MNAEPQKTPETKVIWYIVISIFLHVLIFVSMTRWLQIKDIPQSSLVGPKIKINFVEKAAMDSAAKATPGTQSKVQRLKTTKVKRPKSPEVISFQTKSTGYSSLFPSPYRYDETFIDSNEEADPSKTRMFDAENASFSSDQTTRNLSKIQIFAKELTQLISIPYKLRFIVSNGVAKVRYSRDSQGRWFIENIDGDNYIRALVYEALSGMTATNIAQIKMAESEYNSVRISVNYEANEKTVLESKAPRVRVVGNHIEISYSQDYQNPNWQLGFVQQAAGGPLSVGVNIVGLATVLANKISNDDPRHDLEIRKLRQSPAFMIPIGR